MFCPKDRVEMEKVEMLGVELDVCPLCSGCWLDDTELQRFTRSRGSGALKVRILNPTGTDSRCPRCETILQEGEHEYVSTLRIDQCPNCSGIWLDRGELGRLLSIRT